MVKDNRRIAPPSNCISPNAFQSGSIAENIIKPDETRFDGRKCEDLRPMTLKVGLVPSVTGSAYLEYGNTKVIVSVNGPRDVLHKTDSISKGQLHCEFKYAMFSCKERQSYVPTDEEAAISNALQDALEPVVLLHKFPKARLDIYILVIENDGGAVSAALTCAGAALSNAGVEIYDLPIGCSLVYSGEHILIDPTALEENFRKSPEYARIILGMMPAYNNQVILMESVGSLKKGLLFQGIKSLQAKCQTILMHIKACLKLHLQNSSDQMQQSGDGQVDAQESLQAVELKLFQPHKYMSAFLENSMRPDGRELNEFRSVLINVGSIGTAHGSALVRMHDTSVICGIKGELVNPSPDAPDKGFFVPNVTLTPICSNRYQAGPPTEQPQVYSHIIMDLLKDSDVVEPASLCVAEGRLVWCLFIEMVCLSCDGNILDACILALMAALKNTRLPEVKVEADSEDVKVTDVCVPLTINDFVFPASFAILDDSAVADPSAEEENLARGTLTVLLKADGTSAVHSFGSMKAEQISSCMECSKSRLKEIMDLLKTVN